jgi:hypothetical protein
MKIYFEQKGGIAGVSRSADIDTHLLPPSEEQEVLSLVNNSKFFELPSKTKPPNPGAADYFRYIITLETDDGRKHTVETTDFTGGTGIATLIEFCRRKIAKKH